MSVVYMDIDAISSYILIDLNIFQQDECFCSKLGMEVEYAMYKSNLKTSLSQIWRICQLLPFVRVGQYGSQGLMTLRIGFRSRVLSIQNNLSCP